MRNSSGEVQEWLNWQHWKCCVRETVPWVRIPPSPPQDFRFPIANCQVVTRKPVLRRQLQIGNPQSYQAPDAVQSRGCKPRQAGNGATVADLGCAAASPEPDQFFRT